MEYSNSRYAEPEESVDVIANAGLRRAWTTALKSDDTHQNLRRSVTLNQYDSHSSARRYIPTVPLPGAIIPSTRTRPTVEKELCNFCTTTIITSDEIWGLHHSSYDALKTSANEDYTLCIQLCKDVDEFGQHLPEFRWPLHRFDIRSPERIGDTEDFFAALVFRQAIKSTPTSTPWNESISLPERTFLLFQQNVPERMQPLYSLGESSFSEQTQRTIRGWINECDESYPNCQERADKNFVPTRLLDVKRYEERVSVVQNRAADVRKAYLRSFVREGVPINGLPLSIQEAILATRALGLQYIWIDSLCIVQDSPEDWGIEASLMLQVYRNSFIKFAATDTAGAEGGMCRYRNPRVLLDAEFQGRPNSKIFGNGVWRVVPKALWDEHVLSASLNTRGWVFQERLLSPRLLHFTKNQVFWDCATMSACETFPGGLPQPLDTGSNDRYWRWKLQDSSDLNYFLPTIVDRSLEQFWRNAIRTYSICKLTFRGIAIWGIVRFLIGALKERYAVGVWERNLEEQLSWYVVETRRDDGQPSERPSELDAIPTWSWASMDGEIVIPDRFATVRDYQVTGHDGKQIMFELYGSVNNQSESPRTWAEQLQNYEVMMKKIDELRLKEPRPTYLTSSLDTPDGEKSPESGDGDPFASLIPRLKTPSIAIMGHIGRMQLRNMSSRSEWTLTPIHEHSGLEQYGVLEAFPDVHPGDDYFGETLFLILALSMIYPEGRGGLRREDTVDTCTGVGLMIDYLIPAHNTCSGHFVRTGAFRFTGVRWRMFRAAFIENPEELGIDGEYDYEKGHKIWLD